MYKSSRFAGGRAITAMFTACCRMLNLGNLPAEPHNKSIFINGRSEQMQAGEQNA